MRSNQADPFAKYLGLSTTSTSAPRAQPPRQAARPTAKQNASRPQRVSSSTPFADAMGKALYAPARATSKKGLNSAETLAAQIIDAGKERRGEAVKPVATQPSEADVAAQRIINAGKRRRGEI